MRFESYKIKVGKKIRHLRRSAGFTLPKLAEKAGIPKSNLSKIENKPCNITIDTICSLANALGVTIHQILPK